MQLPVYIRLRDTRLAWIAFGIAMYAFRSVLAARPDFAEAWYGRFVFVKFRWAWDYTLGWSPVPLIYVFLSTVGLYILYKFIRLFWRPKHLAAHEWLYHAVLNIGAFIGGFVGLFLLLWGYNYCRPSLDSQINLNPDTLDFKALRAEAQWISRQASESRSFIPNASSTALTDTYDIPELEKNIRTELTAVLRDLNYPTPGRVRVRVVYPKGILLHASAAGIYLPWVGEGHIDAGLYPIQMPFILAHEMSHGYGFADEGTCNFLAYLACERSTDHRIRYSGRLAYWRYVFAALRKKSTNAYLWERARISPGMFKDLVAIKDQMALYPDLAKGLQAMMTYDEYLRSQGVKEGIASYDNIVSKVIAWRKREGIK